MMKPKLFCAALIITLCISGCGPEPNPEIGASAAQPPAPTAESIYISATEAGKFCKESVPDVASVVESTVMRLSEQNIKVSPLEMLDAIPIIFAGAKEKKSCISAMGVYILARIKSKDGHKKALKEVRDAFLHGIYASESQF